MFIYVCMYVCMYGGCNLKVGWNIVCMCVCMYVYMCVCMYVKQAHVVPPVTENVTKILLPEMCRQKSRAPKFPILEISRPWKRERNKGLK